MALGVCPDCKQPFSSNAKVCPHCGWRKKNAVPGCLVAFGIGAALVFAFFYFAPTPTKHGGNDQATPATDQAAMPPNNVATVSPDNDPAFQPSGTYTFSISALGADMPTITGTTSVPDGTRLFVNIKKPWLPDAQDRLARGLAACGDDCLPAMGPSGEQGADAVVHNGKFSAGPFSFANQPFQPGVFPVEIFIRANKGNETLAAAVTAMTTPAFTTQIEVQADAQP